MDPVKIKGIMEWPTPQNLKELCSFLGFLNFYRSFIENFSKRARPLNDLTCKGRPFIWSQECNDAFVDLKTACSSEPVLKMPNWNKQFIMQTDASNYALGVVIQQEYADRLHPVAFHSCSLLPAEQNYDVHDKELAGVIFGFKNARFLFLGAKHPVIVHTNHKNLQYFRELQKISGHQACWLEYLQDFYYELKHIPSSSNTITDLLSCHHNLNKGVNLDEPCILLPDSLFSCQIFLEDNTDK